MATFNLADFPIHKAESIKEPHSITIFGPPGKGKTVFAASIVEVPGYERVLILDTEGGAVSVGSWYPQVDVLGCPTAASFSKAAEAVLAGKLVERDSGLPYQCVIIDTLDRVQFRQTEEFGKAPEARNNAGVVNTLYKWGAIKIWTDKLSDGFHQAPFLGIFIVHSDDHKDDKTGVVTKTVMLGGSSRENFPSVSDAVGYFDIKRIKGADGKTMEDHRYIDFKPAANTITKQRFADRLNGSILDPTMSKVFDKIRATDTTTN